MAVNHRSWTPIFNHELSTRQSPIFPPVTRSQSARKIQPADFHTQHLAGVFNVKIIQPLIAFFNKCDDQKRLLYLSVIRGLQSVRRLSHYDTMNSRHFSVKEDSRFWTPTRAAPSLSDFELHTSKIPFGTIMNQSRNDPSTALQRMLLTRASEKYHENL